jgi:hypothetical protein
MLFRMKNILSVLGSTFLAVMILSGCGGSGGTCGNTAPCGGDIVGTWTITSSCVSADASMISSMIDTGCPGTTVSGVHVNIAGTVTYKADLTYTASSTLSGSESVTLPASCLMSQGVTATCAQLTQALAGNAAFKSANCTGSSSCTCTVVLMDDTSTQTGTYTTTPAGLLTETAAGGTPDQSDYCVKGNTLTDSPHAGAAMMGQPVSGTITLTKS